MKKTAYDMKISDMKTLHGCLHSPRGEKVKKLRSKRTEGTNSIVFKEGSYKLEFSERQEVQTKILSGEGYRYF